MTLENLKFAHAEGFINVDLWPHGLDFGLRDAEGKSYGDKMFAYSGIEIGGQIKLYDWLKNEANVTDAEYGNLWTVIANLPFQVRP